MLLRKSFEITLKTIHNHIDPNVGYLFSSEISLDRFDIEILKAKSLINVRSGYDNALRISLTPKGVTYFLDKSEYVKKAFIHWTINFSMAVLSAVSGSLLTLAIQHYLIR